MAVFNIKKKYIYISNIWNITYNIMDFEIKCESIESNVIYCGKFSVQTICDFIFLFVSSTEYTCYQR